MQRKLLDIRSSPSNFSGGEGGIRTHGTREGTTVFETARFSHSRTSPHWLFAFHEKTIVSPRDNQPQASRLRPSLDDSKNRLCKYQNVSQPPRPCRPARRKPAARCARES